ncbi:hypothetical protein [Haloferax sp. YSMS24]|uniref:hypothetical protein n=1 Tax=Haloferax sp. YSMS24 TaxID=3388425 RepID=UPI00398C853D
MARYVLKPAVVQNAIEKLIQSSVHRMFPGYLCLKQQAEIHNRDSDLPFPYTEFFNQYFRVPGGQKPYLVPFTPTENPSDENLWVNNNVAGTYAPSSLRVDSPFTKVVKVEESGHDSRWRLQPSHWKLARHHLCNGETLPAESLAAFLFRDYAFEAEEASAYTLIQTFEEEFGYKVSGPQFATLYHTGDTNINADSFERYD